MGQVSPMPAWSSSLADPASALAEKLPLFRSDAGCWSSAPAQPDIASKDFADPIGGKPVSTSLPFAVMTSTISR